MEDFRLTENEAKEFGNYLKKIREDLGMSTNKVELLTNINKSELSRIENGKKKIINGFYIKELARIYKKDVLELFKKIGFIDEKVPQLSKRERVQYDTFMEGANLFFNDENVSEDDKDKLMASLNDLYFRVKKLKKEKRKNSQK